jgi:CheY-like chemotaxis protein
VEVDSRAYSQTVKRVLIVDDDADVRRLLKRLLRDLVQEFTECESGAEAVAIFLECRPEIVLMDIQLPGSDGLTLTRQILDACPSAVVVVVTNYHSLSLRRAAREASAAAYMLKENLFEVRTLIEERFHAR